MILSFLTFLVNFPIFNFLFFHQGFFLVSYHAESGSNGGRCKYLPSGVKYYNIHEVPINVIGYLVLAWNQCVISVPAAFIKGSTSTECYL